MVASDSSRHRGGGLIFGILGCALALALVGILQHGMPEGSPAVDERGGEASAAVAPPALGAAPPPTDPERAAGLPDPAPSLLTSEPRAVPLSVRERPTGTIWIDDRATFRVGKGYQLDVRIECGARALAAYSAEFDWDPADLRIDRVTGPREAGFDPPIVSKLEPEAGRLRVAGLDLDFEHRGSVFVATLQVTVLRRPPAGMVTIVAADALRSTVVVYGRDGVTPEDAPCAVHTAQLQVR